MLVLGFEPQPWWMRTIFLVWDFITLLLSGGLAGTKYLDLSYVNCGGPFRCKPPRRSPQTRPVEPFQTSVYTFPRLALIRVVLLCCCILSGQSTILRRQSPYQRDQKNGALLPALPQKPRGGPRVNKQVTIPGKTTLPKKRAKELCHKLTGDQGNEMLRHMAPEV